MPAKSKAQQQAAGAALPPIKRQKQSELKGASKSMAKSMSKEQLEEFASTKQKAKSSLRSRQKRMIIGKADEALSGA